MRILRFIFGGIATIQTLTLVQSKKLKMDSNFWNARYKEKEYAYGTTPNDFLKSHIQILKPHAKVLCLAEGEGRNAVFISENNHDVTAIDYSQEGLNKLNSLAKEKDLSIKTICADLTDYKIESNTWDAIICIFGHFPSPLRTSIFSQVYSGLTKDGVLLLEAYNKDQINYKTGGPQVADLLYSREELQHDFSEFEKISIEKQIKYIEEGKYHKGTSAVIQVIAHKI